MSNRSPSVAWAVCIKPSKVETKIGLALCAEDVLRTLRKVSFSGLCFGTFLQEFYKRILQEFAARVLAGILPFYFEPNNFILHQRFYEFHKKLSLAICLKFSSLF